MSKEVEVTGIHMTATVPASIQLSLGKGMNTAIGLDTQTIDSTGSGATNRLTAVTAPDDDEYWSNSVDVSEYYQFGRLTPATSAKGDDIFYTADITGVGKTLKGHTITTNGVMGSGTTTANFEQADTADALGATNKTVSIAAINNRTATTDPLATGDKYSEGGAYYVDIPVWFRTSITTADVKLAVKATFIQGSNDYTMSSGTAKVDQLYKAARVSILKGNNTTTGTNTGVQGVIMDSGTNYYRTENGAKLSGSADPYTVNATGAAAAANWIKVVKTKQYTSLTSDGVVADATADVDSVVTITKASTGATWGEAAPYTIRVWLDGEDVNCWNATAGQDFGINLSFAQVASN